MKVLTKRQIQFLLDEKITGDFVDKTTMTGLFDFYGDDYFRGHYTEPLELCRENPHWDDWRKDGRLPRKDIVKITFGG